MNTLISSTRARGQSVDRNWGGLYRWYVLAILTLIYACHFLDRTVVSIVVEPIRKEFGLSDGQIGLLTGMAYALTFAVAGIPIGLLIDRVNRRNLAAAVAFVWSAATALAGFAQNYVSLLLARMAVGAAESGGESTSLSILSDLFPQRLRSTVIGIFFLSIAVGAAGSAIIGAAVAGHYGWRAAFFVAGIPGMLLAVLVLTTIKEPRRGAMDGVADDMDPKSNTGPSESALGVRTVLRFVRGQRSLLHLLVALPLVSAGMAALGAWLPAFLQRSHGMDIKMASFVLALAFGACSALGSLLGGLISDWLGKHGGQRRLLFAAAVVLLGVPAALGATLLGQTSAAVALMFLLAASGFAAFPAGFGSMLGLVRPRMRGLTTAIMQVCTNFIGYGVGPSAVGLLSDCYGGPQSLRYAIATVMTVALVWAALHLMLASRSYARDEARALTE